MGIYGVQHHEDVGRAYCDALGFPPRVGAVVAGHVKAKRYLCWKQPAYHAKLSEASTQTLRHQGGPMTDAEARAFEADPLFDVILKMRTWDESAKVVGMQVPPLEAYRETIEKLVAAHTVQHTS
jgi:predicted HD phosphohydrolase